MTSLSPGFRRFVILIVVGLVVSGCGQHASSIEVKSPNIEDPAIDVTYGVEEIPYQENPVCGPVFNGLTLIPPNSIGLHLAGDEVMDDIELTALKSNRLWLFNSVIGPQYLITVTKPIVLRHRLVARHLCREGYKAFRSAPHSLKADETFTA